MGWATKLNQFLKGCYEWVWPSMGWKRFIHFQFLRLSRITGGRRAIARGFACGVAVSFSPFIGLHFVLSGIAARAIQGSVVAALIGTAVGNPWTFPFIWSASFSLGSTIIDPHEQNAFSFDKDFDWATLINNPLDIFFPMLIGAIPLMLIFWPIAYFTTLRIITWRDKRYKARKAPQL